MAANCDYTYEGKTYKEQEFKALLLDGLYDKLKEEGLFNKENSGGKSVGVSHDRLNSLAKELGLPEIPRGEVLTPKEYAERGRRLIEAGVNPLEVAEQFKKDGLVNADRISIVRAHLEKLVKDADNIGKEKGFKSKEYQDAKEKADEFSREIVKPMGTESGASFRSLQGERDLDTDSFTTVQKNVEDLTGKPTSKEQDTKIEELTNKNQELQKQLSETEQKLIDATNEAVGSEPKKDKKQTPAEKTKSIADKLRKAKIHKPDSFSAATPASLVWDSAVEIVAKTIEAGGKIADAINVGIKSIRESDWYKNLAEDKKQKVESDFTDWSIDELVDKSSLDNLQKRFLNKKDNKFSIEESKMIWDYARKTYLDNGVPYIDMIGKVANDIGLSWRQISEAITSPKVKSISDEMWKRRSDLIKNQNATKRWIEEQDKSVAGKALRKVSGLFRGVAVFGHGGIFVGTHSGMNLFSPTKWNKVIPAFINGYKFAYGNEAAYHRSMEELKNRSNYTLAQRAGLKNNPDHINVEEYQKSQHWLKKMGNVGEKGFNAIKVLRQDLFDYHFNRLTPEEKADPKSAESVAQLVNLATGATNLNIPEWVNEITFAGGMEAARWGKLTRSPYEATKTALKVLMKPESATVGERVFAKIWAKRVGEQVATFASILAANAAIQSVINPSNKVNLTDPDKADFLKFKFGDISVDPTSGMRGVASFMYGLGKIPFESKKELRGSTRLEEAGKKTFGYSRGKLAPFYSTLVDLFTKTDYYGNPLPFSNDKAGGNKHKLTWGEYLWQKAPLPLAEAAHETYKSINEHDNDKTFLKHVLGGIFMGALSGSTGFRFSEAPEKQNESITESDKKDPTFKYFIDKGMELPNVSNSSEKIKDPKTNTIKTISEYDEKIQENYNETHKEELKNELKKIQDKGYVYVVTYTDSKGQEEKEVSFSFKNNGKITKIDDLDKDELSQVLSQAQKQATRKSKKKIFGVE